MGGVRHWQRARWAVCALVLAVWVLAGCSGEEDEGIQVADGHLTTPGPTAFAGDLWEDGSFSDCDWTFGFGTRNPYILDWSPDGQNLVFQDGDQDRIGSRLLVVDAGGTRLRTLAIASEDTPHDDLQLGFWASVSPANGDVIYSSCEFPGKPLNEAQRGRWGPAGWTNERATLIEPRSAYSYELAVVALDGASKPNPIRALGSELGVVWSPDGRRFAYVHERDGLVVREEGSGGRVVRRGTVQLELSARAGGLRWSPDGTRILFSAYTGGRDSYETTLYVVDVNTALEAGASAALTAIVVTEPLVNVTVGSFSPDGEQVVWGERLDERDENEELIYGGQLIYVGSADGSSKRRVVAFPGGDSSRQKLREVR